MAKIPQKIDLTVSGQPEGSFIVFLRKRDDQRQTQYYARRLIPMEMRTNPRNPYIMQALGTLDPEEAKRIAWQWMFGIEAKLLSREPLRVPLFRDAALSWLKSLEQNMARLDHRGRPMVKPTKYRRHEGCVRRYLMPFFGDKSVTAINNDDCDRWLDWRLNYYTENAGKDETEIVYMRGGKVLKLPVRRTTRPADSTIQKDVIAFSEIIEHARIRLNVRFDKVPKLPLKRQNIDTRRPRFYPDEWKSLMQAMMERRRSGSKPWKRGEETVAGGAINAKSRWSREMLWFFAKFLHGTGIRVSEAMYLQCKHLMRVAENQKYTDERISEMRGLVGTVNLPEADKLVADANQPGFEYRIEISPDNPGLKQPIHARTVIPLHETTSVINALTMFLWMKLPKSITGNPKHPIDLPPDLYLWCHRDGTRISSFSNGFDSVLDATGLTMVGGKKRSLTSIRHTYASERIEAGATRKGISFLADNMGTTAEMIRKHYGQSFHELEALELQQVRS